MPSEQNRPATLSEQMANSRQSPPEGTPNPSGRSESDLAGDRTSEQAFVQVAFQDTTPESPSANSAQAKLAQQPDDAPPVAPPLPTIPGTPTPLPGSGNQGVISPALPAEQIPEEISPGVEAAPLNQRVVTLEDVLSSVENHFPLLIAAAAEQQVADGKLLAAQGAFDLQARASTINQPLGFYQNYRAGALLSQPLYDLGGYLYGGYKLGRGDFPTWYKERQTDGN